MNQPANYPDVAVLIPCFNEEVSVGKVISDFKDSLPGAHIYVFDNNSTDRTAEVARARGATVVASPRQGKGHVVRHMLDEVEASIYLMVDGDDTYPAAQAPELVQELRSSGADMIVGLRIANQEEGSFRRFHRAGNRVVARLISTLFRVRVNDVMSGYRVLSREFARSVPLLSGGFEIETEMTLHAAARGYVIREVPVRYRGRSEGSVSKLRTFSDGYLVLRTIFQIFKDYKPLVFFSLLAFVLAALSLAAGWGPVYDYLTTGKVARFPSAILAAALGILSALSLGIGIILDTFAKFQQENFELLRKLIRR
ncbi:MAG: glycosyltransferase family 2 protein [Acidobacteriota bacterium]